MVDSTGLVMQTKMKAVTTTCKLFIFFITGTALTEHYT